MLSRVQCVTSTSSSSVLLVAPPDGWTRKLRRIRNGRLAPLTDYTAATTKDKCSLNTVTEQLLKKSVLYTFYSKE